MASLLADRKGYLLIQFRYQGQLCREYLNLRDTQENRRQWPRHRLNALGVELRRPDFDYAKWFPKSRRLQMFVEPKPAIPTVSAYYARWLDTLEISKATKYDYECLGRAFLTRTMLGERLIGSVTAMDVREVVKAVAGVRRPVMFLQRMRAMYDAAIADGLCSVNPARAVKNPKQRTRREPVEPFTLIEQSQILEASSGQDRNMIAVMLGTGTGPGELLALRRKDVDLKSRRLAITASLGRFGEGATKTVGRTRVIDLTDTVAPVVAALRAQLSVARLHGPLFANHLGAHLNFSNWRRRNWANILKAAKVQYRNPYACRHTYAIRMLEAGHDVVTVARQMGHTSPEMINRHYARWTNRLADTKANGV